MEIVVFVLFFLLAGGFISSRLVVGAISMVFVFFLSVIASLAVVIFIASILIYKSPEQKMYDCIHGYIGMHNIPVAPQFTNPGSICYNKFL